MLLEGWWLFPVINESGNSPKDILTSVLSSIKFNQIPYETSFDPRLMVSYQEQCVPEVCYWSDLASAVQCDEKGGPLS